MNEPRRPRANTLSTIPLGAQAPSESPLNSPSSLRQSRRGSVIVQSNPNSGALTPRSCEWDNFTEQPTFWNSRFGWINQPSRIRLVSTETESSIGVGSN